MRNDKASEQLTEEKHSFQNPLVVQQARDDVVVVDGLFVASLPGLGLAAGCSHRGVLHPQAQSRG